MDMAQLLPSRLAAGLLLVVGAVGCAGGSQNAPPETRPLTVPLSTTAAAAAAAAGAADVRVPPKGFTPLPMAVQTIYQKGVPHTDRNGNRLMKYDAAKSYLPLILYDAQIQCNRTGENRSTEAQKEQALLRGQTCLPWGTNATIYEEANFTGVLPYQSVKMMSYMQPFPAGFGGTTLQIIRESPTLVVANMTHPTCPPQCDGPAENEPLQCE